MKPEKNFSLPAVRTAILALTVCWLTMLVAGRVVGGTTTVPALGGEAMVVSAHLLATRIGLEILHEGGNAVDAAVAVAFALAVVEPYSSGLGGGGFAVTFAAERGEVQSLDFRETAPASAHRDMYLVDGQADSHLSQTGVLAVAVPGQLRGLQELHRAGGRLRWARLVTPAVSLARDGFHVTAFLREKIEYHADRFNSAAREIFLPGGRLPAVGQLLRQPDLATTLQSVAANGSAAFYTGPIAALLLAAVQDEGGLLTATDLVAYQPQWREPVRGHYRGLDFYGMPPPSSGGVHLIQMLNVLEGFDLGGRFWHEVSTANVADDYPSGHGVYFKYAAADLCHVMIETMKFAYADRSHWLGDPDQVRVPAARLTSRGYADSLRARIVPDRALPWRELGGSRVLPPEGNHTTHVSVVDSAGNAVAMTLTINLNFGSGLVAAGTGVLLNDEMDDFVAAPGVPNAFGLIGGEENAVASGKRPLSSMTPTLALQDGRVVLVVGGSGGPRIITSVLQVILNLVDEGMDVAHAVAAPRIHHQWYPPVVYYESDGMTSGCRDELQKRGHTLRLRAPMANVQVIWVDSTTTVRHGASDPRGMGAAAGF